MRLSLSLSTLALAIALVGCDAAAPDAPATEARPADAGFLVRTSDLATGQSSERRQDKLAVCHYDDETDSYELISVGAPALPAHLRHGDGVPGGEVAGADEPSVFGEGCEVVPVALPVGCSAERVVNGDGMTTVSVTAVLPEGDRPATILFTSYGPGSDGVHDLVSVGGSELLFEDGVLAGLVEPFTYSEGADDTLQVTLVGTGGEISCGPYVVSEIPLAGPEA